MTARIVLAPFLSTLACLWSAGCGGSGTAVAGCEGATTSCDASADNHRPSQPEGAAVETSVADSAPPPDAPLPDASTDLPASSPGDAVVSGDPAVTTDGPGDGLEPVRVIRGAPDERLWHDVVVEGQGFSDLDGRIVTVRIGFPSRPPERLASGQARIDMGAFSIRLPGAMESGRSKRKLVQIDADGDRLCSAADLMFEDSGFADGATPTDFVMKVTPTSINKVGPSVIIEAECESFRNWPLE